MLDIHTHLYWKSYDTDRDQVVKRAQDAGVEHMLVIGCTVDESRQAVETARKYSLVAAVGIHPHEFNDDGSTAWDNFSYLKDLNVLAKDPQVVAIGECGLDYFSHDLKRSISHEERARQKKGFEAHIHLAAERGLPLIVHCRDAYEDMLGILQAHGPTLPIILHCYMGDTEVTKKFLDLPNVHFSFTGNITYPVKKSVAGTKDDLAEIVKLVPLERLFTETDCPFLTPQPKRGERNEPAYVRYVLETVARIKQEDMKEVENVVEENYQRIFNA